jgi:hypothetical protein
MTSNDVYFETKMLIVDRMELTDQRRIKSKV